MPKVRIIHPRSAQTNSGNPALSVLRDVSAKIVDPFHVGGKSGRCENRQQQ
jgi:hypothetical protein